MLSTRPPSFLLPSSRKSDVFFTFPRPTNELMAHACTERLVQVIKVTERLLMEPQSCGRMCLSAPEGQDCLPESRSVEKPFSIEVICITIATVLFYTWRISDSIRHSAY